MLNLAVLLQLVGLILTFTLGVAGYFIGPCVVIAGGILYRRERKRRINAPAPVAPVEPKRPLWQRIGLAATGLMVLVGALVAIVFHMTSGLTESADEFFLAMKSSDLTRAKAFLSEDFRVSTSDESLRQFVEHSALSQYASSSWDTRSVTNGRGELEGTVNTISGGAVPISMSFVKEKTGWKIYAIRKPDAGLRSIDATPGRPSDSDQTRLVRATTHAFADAVSRRDFSEFHASIAGLWQKQITKDQLAAAFKAFVDSGVNFLVLDSLQPALSAADFNSSGALVLKGTYATTPHPVRFEQSFVYEGVDWKLVGLSMHTE